MTQLRKRMLDDPRIRNYAPVSVECYIRSVAELAKLNARSISASRDPFVAAFLANEKEVKVSSYIQSDNRGQA